MVAPHFPNTLTTSSYYTFNKWNHKALHFGTYQCSEKLMLIQAGIYSLLYPLFALSKMKCTAIQQREWIIKSAGIPEANFGHLPSFSSFRYDKIRKGFRSIRRVGRISFKR
jgi:hypothetical protein